MTTIAYRAGIIAADTLLCRGDSALAGMTKVARGEDGRLGGACGSASFLVTWLRWIAGEGERPTPVHDKDCGSDCGLVVWPDGRIELHEPGGAFTVTAPYIAIGTGRPEALGAMFAGADAELAVRAAITHDCHTGGEVTVLRREA